MFRAILIAVAVLSPPPPQPATQPVDVPGAGRFTMQTLPGRVGIDGRAWLRAEAQTGQNPAFTPAGADFVLRFSNPVNDAGVQRWTVTLERPGRAPVLLTGGSRTRFVYVTPDARFVFVEPFTAIDVRAWQRYDLRMALGIEPHVTVRAIRPDGRELFLERSACLVDCGSRSDEEYVVLTLPD